MDTFHVDIQQAVAPKLSTALQTLVFGPVHLTDMSIQSLSALKIQKTPSAVVLGTMEWSWFGFGAAETAMDIEWGDGGDRGRGFGIG